MKSRLFCSASLSFPLAVLLAAQSASATDFYWDGVTANWSTPSAWSTTAAGTTNPGAFPTSSTSSDLIFNITSANAASSNISNAGGLRNARSLTFNTSGTTNMRAGGNSGVTSLLTIGAGGITLGASSGNVTLGDAPASFGTVNVALATSQIWTNNSASTLTVNGAVSGNFDLTKSGSGQIRLNGANDYSGTTAVNSGRLLIGTSGSLSNTSTVTVGGAAATGTPTLGGGGTLAGATTIAAAGGGVVGTHAPGFAGVGGGVGSQTFSNDLTYQTGSIFEWDINTAANTSDSVSVGGTLTIDSGAIFKIVSSTAFTDVFWDVTRNWNVFGGKDYDAFTLNFIANGTPQVADDFSSQGNFTFTNSGSTLTWNAVPEPSSTLAGLVLGVGLLRRRRK